MNYHAITITVSFGVMADSVEDAERIAERLTDGLADEVPVIARVSLEAHMTRNQAPYIHQQAVNFGEPA